MPCTANDIVIAKVKKVLSSCVSALIPAQVVLDLPPTDLSGNPLPTVNPQQQSACQTPGVAPPSYCTYTCQPNQLIKLSLGATFVANAFSRYDMGKFFAFPRK